MEFSIKKTISAVPIDKIKIFSDKNVTITKPYDFIKISDKFNYSDYSEFLIKGLGNHIDTSHVLVTQYDGFGVNSEYWKDEYLKYDFIGPPTSLSYPPISAQPPGLVAGNGRPEVAATATTSGACTGLCGSSLCGLT
jgi:hypothetical protein